jgi:ribosomal protein S18 acetylase RimI-like enzyme
MEIRNMELSDCDSCLTLWQSSPGVRVTDEDAPAAIAALLSRNPGMSFVAVENGEIVGTSLCGHDGRRGFIYHVAVRPAYRGKHIGTMLVEACLGKLREAGIHKCHVFVLQDNPIGNAFWASIFNKRDDIVIYSRMVQ